MIDSEGRPRAAKAKRANDAHDDPFRMWESQFQGQLNTYLVSIAADRAHADVGWSRVADLVVAAGPADLHRHALGRSQTDWTNVVSRLYKDSRSRPAAPPSLVDSVTAQVRELVPPHVSVERVDRDIRYVVDRLLAFMHEGQARNWLYSHNERLSSRPVDALAMARTGAVIDAVDAQESFAF